MGGFGKKLISAPLVPSTNPWLRSCFQSLMAYSNREVFGFVGWCVETKTWVTHWKVIHFEWRSSEIVTAEPVSPSKKDVSPAKGKYVVYIKSSKGKDVTFIKSSKKSEASRKRKTCVGKISTSSPKISKKIRMSVSVDLRDVKPVVLGL